MRRRDAGASCRSCPATRAFRQQRLEGSRVGGGGRGGRILDGAVPADHVAAELGQPRPVDPKMPDPKKVGSLELPAIPVVPTTMPNKFVR